MKRRFYLGILKTLLAAAVLAGLVVYFMRPTPIRVARHALLEAAGAESRECGWSGPDKDRLRQKTCVEEAVAKHEPFIVLYEVWGKEEPAEVGLAGDRQGHVYQITVEAGDSFGPAYRQMVREGRQVKAVACPLPGKFQQRADGVLFCAWK